MSVESTFCHVVFGFDESAAVCLDPKRDGGIDGWAERSFSRASLTSNDRWSDRSRPKAFGSGTLGEVVSMADGVDPSQTDVSRFMRVDRGRNDSESSGYSEE